MENFIEINGVSKYYGSTIALNNISLTIPSGEIVGLLGVNGSGKTTLLKILANLINDYSGKVLIDGKCPSAETKQYVALLPDVSFISPSWNVSNAVAYFADFFSDFDKNKAINLLKDFKIPLNMQFKSLSKGTKEKLQLILIMSRNARLYMFDEPIAGVDPIARDVIINLIMQHYNKDSSIIISTHLVNSVGSIADSCVFMKYGEIVLHERLDFLQERFNKNSLEEIFKEIY